MIVPGSRCQCPRTGLEMRYTFGRPGGTHRGNRGRVITKREHCARPQERSKRRRQIPAGVHEIAEKRQAISPRGPSATHHLPVLRTSEGLLSPILRGAPQPCAPPSLTRESGTAGGVRARPLRKRWGRTRHPGAIEPVVFAPACTYHARPTRAGAWTPAKGGRGFLCAGHAGGALIRTCG